MTTLGLNRPSGLAVGGGPVWDLLEALPTPRRNSLVENLRLQQVYQAIYATSLDVALADTPVGRIRDVVADAPARRGAGGRPGRRPGADARPAPGPRPDVREDRPDAGQPARPAAGRMDGRAGQAPERGPAVLVGRGAGGPAGRARPRAGVVLRVDRDRAVRGGLDRPGPPGHDVRRPRRSRSRSSGRRSWPRRRPTWGSSRSSRRWPRRASRWPARSAPRTSSASSPPACCASSTTATRPTRPSAWPTAWPSSRASTCPTSSTSCRPRGS